MNLKKSHKCILDPKKIVIGPDGKKFSKRGTVRLKRADNHARVADMPRLKKEVDKDEIRVEFEPIPLIDKIIETEDGMIHTHGEQLVPTKESSQNTSYLENLPKLPAGSSPVLDLILRDPVYQRLGKERPEIESDFMGGSKLDTGWGNFSCSSCGGKFERFWSLNLHQKKCLSGTSNSGEKPTSVKSEARDNLIQVNLLCGECGYQAKSQKELEQYWKPAENHLSFRRHRCPYPSCVLWNPTHVKEETARTYQNNASCLMRKNSNVPRAHIFSSQRPDYNAMLN